RRSEEFPKDWHGCEKSFLLPSRSCETARKIIARTGRRSSAKNCRNPSRATFRNKFRRSDCKGADMCLPLFVCRIRFQTEFKRQGQNSRLGIFAPLKPCWERDKIFLPQRNNAQVTFC